MADVIGYHVTASRNRTSIERAGLLTKPPLIYESGKVEEGWDAGMIWFFVDLDVAKEAANAPTWGGGLGGNEVWMIDLDGLDVIPDPHPGWGNFRPGWDDVARAVRQDIEPERLTLLQPGS